MENRLDKLVDAIKNEKPVDAEELFKAEMGDRLKSALADRKVEIGKQLFSKEKESLSKLDKLINPDE